jgi:two-component system chemotaxis sensor kinase CheA
LLTANGIHKILIDTALQKQQSTDRSSEIPRQSENQSLRIDAAKLDDMINTISALVIYQTNNELLAKKSAIPELIEVTQTLSNLVNSISQSCMDLRMIPIGQTFSRFQRVIRDINKALGKDVRLSCHGDDTELDKSMVEQLNDLILHLVRNALDHGIESEAERLKAGKTPWGKLTLNAYHQSDYVVIEVADDGRGIDPQKVAQKAIENNLISNTQGMTEQQILQLILMPGFTTSDTFSELSGRGVGMDVVIKNTENLRGNLQIDNKLGQGTTMRLRMPLTLAIIDGFLLAIANNHYIIPLDGVVECIEMSSVVDDSALGNHLFYHQNEVLPLVHMRAFFGQQGDPPDKQNIIVVRNGNDRIGLVIDRPIGEFQTVIKPLCGLFSHHKWLAGSTILGNGEVAMIIDINGLISHSHQRLQPQATGH